MDYRVLPVYCFSQTIIIDHLGFKEHGGLSYCIKTLIIQERVTGVLVVLRLVSNFFFKKNKAMELTRGSDQKKQAI